MIPTDSMKLGAYNPRKGGDKGEIFLNRLLW